MATVETIDTFIVDGPTIRPHELAMASMRMLASRRHRMFKLKIGKRDLRDDVARVGAICRALGDRASVRVDVNQNRDETLHGPRDAFAIAARAGARVFAAKIAQSGGLPAAHDVADHAAPNDVLTSPPLFPFMTMRVAALCRHPSSLHEDDR